VEIAQELIHSDARVRLIQNMLGLAVTGFFSVAWPPAIQEMKRTFADLI
jgi:hypothetical protein